MSLLNVLVREQDAFVAVDTLASGGTMSKMIPLLHTGVVFAGRGDRRFLHDLFDVYYLGSGHFDFDEIIHHMPTAIRAVADHQGREKPGQELGDYIVTVVGWSAKDNRMRGFTFSGLNKPNADIRTDPVKCNVGPWESNERPPMPDGPENLLALAAKQVPMFKALNTIGGGNLIMAHITKDEIHVRNLGAI